eukprot:Skav208495  [mRNA]  locus=scaffold87:205950:208673:- [translate_table: standard]
MSILAILIFGLHWAKQQLAIGTIPQVYADNLSWRSIDETLHSTAWQMTVQLMDALSLIINSQQTWAWATSKSHRIALKNLQQDIGQDFDLRFSLSSRELGYQIMYTRFHCRETQKNRMELSFKRLEKIAKLEVNFETKAKLIAETALSSAMFGAHTYVMGSQLLQRLRTAMCNALIGTYGRSNSYIALMAFHPFLQDPEFWVIYKAIVASRTFLLTTTSSEAARFLHVASRHSGLPLKVYGPAGALCNYISRVGWQIDSHGYILVAPQVKLHICHSDLMQIKECLVFYWMQHVMQCCHDRPTWQGAPTISRPENIRRFGKLDSRNQFQLVKELSGAFMTEDRIAEFSEVQSDKCMLCGEPAGVEHQLLHCEATQALRDKYDDVIRMLQTYDVIHQYLPHHYEDAFWEFRLALQHTVEPVHFSQQTLADVHATVNQHSIPVFFTDGSCLHAEDSLRRVASFAIVLYTGNASVDHLETSEQVTLQDFKVLHMGRCQGRQVINRSELQAVLGIMDNVPSAIIYTDSQYVVDLVAILQKLPSAVAMHKKPSFDLLHRLCERVTNGRYDVRKVKAHQELSKDTSNADRFRILGNQVADSVAKASAAQLVKRLHLVHQQLEEPLDHLIQDRTRHWSYLLELKQQRAASLKTIQTEDTVQRGSGLNFLEWTKQYVPQGEQWHPHVFNAAELIEICSQCMWGDEFALAFYNWCHTLTWRKDEDPTSVYQKTGKVALGISWTELVVNFCILTQQWVPTPVGGGKHASFRVQTFAYPQRVSSNSFSAMVLALQSMSRFWTAVTGKDLLPRQELTDVRSLRFFGQKGYCRGFKLRPQVSQQALTMQVVKDYISQTLETPLEAVLPVLPSVTAAVAFSVPMVVETDTAANLDVRFQKYRLQAAKVRRAVAAESTSASHS